MSLKDYALIENASALRSSSWDRTGGNIDCVTDIAPGATVTLLDTAGPGKVTHIWITMMEYPGHETHFRDMVIRMFWDGAVPSAESPLGDFFGIGHALTAQYYTRRKYSVVSEPVVVGHNERAMNCYWPMPFHKSARIEVVNNGARTLRIIYYHVDYELGPQPADAGLFHAVFRQETAKHGQAPDDNYTNLDGKDNYVLMETEGRGHYAGCFYYIDNDAGGWWGEGDDMIFIDHSELPTITGTGSEDYFNNAWGFAGSFCYPYYGAPLFHKREDGGGYTSLYRFHIPDPVRFQTHIKVTMECWWHPEKTMCVSSVAFWYQQKPLTSRAPLPLGAANHPGRRLLEEEDHWLWDATNIPEGTIHIRTYELEESLRNAGLKVRTIARIGQIFLHLRGFLGGIVIDTGGRDAAIPLTGLPDGRYRVEVKPVYAEIAEPMKLWVEGGAKIEAARQILPREDEGAFLDLGEAIATGGKLVLNVTGAPLAPVHAIRLTKQP